MDLLHKLKRWDAFCILTDQIYGLIFLKYISDRFEEKHREPIGEGDGFEEDIDGYTSEGIFFVPQGTDLLQEKVI